MSEAVAMNGIVKAMSIVGLDDMGTSSITLNEGKPCTYTR